MLLSCDSTEQYIHTVSAGGVSKSVRLPVSVRCATVFLNHFDIIGLLTEYWPYFFYFENEVCIYCCCWFGFDCSSRFRCWCPQGEGWVVLWSSVPWLPRFHHWSFGWCFGEAWHGGDHWLEAGNVLDFILITPLIFYRSPTVTPRRTLTAASPASTALMSALLMCTKCVLSTCCLAALTLLPLVTPLTLPGPSFCAWRLLREILLRVSLAGTPTWTPPLSLGPIFRSALSTMLRPCRMLVLPPPPLTTVSSSLSCCETFNNSC